MKIGIISDTHDHLRNLKAALEVLQAEGVTTICHCGDVCGPEIVQALAGFDVWVAEGNVDRQLGLTQAVKQMLKPGRLAWFHRPALDGVSLAMVHGDDEEALGSLITSGQYAYVLRGHTHRRQDKMVGHTRVINPGALGGTRWQSRSFCILDLATGEAHFVEL
jgi:putative phosphoesterase